MCGVIAAVLTCAAFVTLPAVPGRPASEGRASYASQASDDVLGGLQSHTVVLQHAPARPHPLHAPAHSPYVMRCAGIADWQQRPRHARVKGNQ